MSPVPYLQKRIKCVHRCGFNLRDTAKNRDRMERHERERCEKRPARRYDRSRSRLTV
jgi:hypothetical protein